jgi:hypothetical protein
MNDRAPKAGLLVGVTNPFFEKTCSHWPHVLTLGGKFWQVDAGYSSLLFLISFLAIQIPQHVSLAPDRRLDGKLKPTNDIRQRTASSFRRWRSRQEMEIRKRVSHASHTVRWPPDPLHPSG